MSHLGAALSQGITMRDAPGGSDDCDPAKLKQWCVGDGSNLDGAYLVKEYYINKVTCEIGQEIDGCGAGYDCDPTCTSCEQVCTPLPKPKDGYIPGTQTCVIHDYLGLNCKWHEVDTPCATSCAGDTFKTPTNGCVDKGNPPFKFVTYGAWNPYPACSYDQTFTTCVTGCGAPPEPADNDTCLPGTQTWREYQKNDNCEWNTWTDYDCNSNGKCPTKPPKPADQCVGFTWETFGNWDNGSCSWTPNYSYCDTTHGPSGKGCGFAPTPPQCVTEGGNVFAENWQNVGNSQCTPLLNKIPCVGSTPNCGIEHGQAVCQGPT